MFPTDRQRDILSFVMYFVGLRLRIALGQYYTANPVDLRWRWRHWHQLKAIKERFG